MGDGTSQVDVTITVNADAHPDIGRLVEQLSDKGLEQANGLANLGLVTGTIASDKIDLLRAIPGVTAVEIAGGVQLPPPDADVQ